MRLTVRQQAAMKGTRMRELTAHGYKSDIFPAKWRGGKCGISGLVIHVSDPVAFFRDFGLCHAVAITNLIHQEKRAALPKCGCGRPVDDERQGCCLLCSYAAENWLDQMYEDVTRDSQPVSASTL